MAPPAAHIHSSLPLPNPKQVLHTSRPVDKHVFPDGLKTTGQQPPLSTAIYPYASFPKTISGPTLWKPEDYATHPEQWIHPFSAEEIEELSRAADEFVARGLPLTGIDRGSFRLPVLEARLESMRAELLNGKGFLLCKGIPVKEWGNHKSAVAYIGLGSHLGYPVSQNGKGHILGHVKDLGEDSAKIDEVRIYRTNARQFFHADECDIVGLLCVARAEEGGESDLASVHLVWNTMQRERPDLAELFTRPVWYFDRKGEVSRGEEEWIRGAVFYLETPSPDTKFKGEEEEGTMSEPEQQRVYCKWDPYYVRSLTRFSDAGIIPPLSPEQVEATQYLEDLCNRVKLHMVLEVGDIQFVANSHTLHARTAYRDFGPDSGMPRRHLMRLWLSTPASEGGWRLPFWDADEKKRGGIQVDDVPPVARLDAD